MTSEQPSAFNLVPAQYTSKAGEEVAPTTVLQQVQWLIELVNTQANAQIAKHFNATDLTELHKRTKPTSSDPLHDTDQYQLPASAHASAHRLGWNLDVTTA